MDYIIPNQEPNDNEIKHTYSKPDSSKESDIKDYDKRNPLLDQIINKSGYCIEVWKVIGLVSLTLFIEGIHLTTFSVLFTPFQKMFSLTFYGVSMVSSMIFLTVGIGSLLAGFLGSKFQRTHIIIFGTFSMSLFTFLIELVPNIYAFTIFRCLVGFFIGVNVPIIFCILTEYLPLYLRSFVLVFVWTTFSMGTLFLIWVAEIIMPNQEPSRTLKVIFVMALPPFLISLVYGLFLNDSPRNLILHSKDIEAFKIIEKIRGTSLTLNEKNRIKSEVLNGEKNKYVSGEIKSLFKPNNLLTSSLLVIIWIISSILSYTPMIIMSLTLKKTGVYEAKTNIYHQLTIVNLIGLFGNFIAGTLSEIKILGRKMSIVLGFALFAYTTLISTFVPKYFELFLGIQSIFISISFNIIGAYTCEFYATKIRETANGFFFFNTRLGGFLSQFLGVSLDKINTMLPYWTISGIAIAGAIVTSMLPHDTQGQFLDIDLDKEEKRGLKDEAEDEYECK